MEKIIGFHATDKALADSIIANGFSFSRSEEHWLGNGVYFFADPDLAVWWSGNPTNKFGVHIITPCVLKTTIESDAICDMRELKYYNLVTALYIQFYHNTGIRLDSSGISKTQYFNRIRCAFFDWLHSHSNIEVVMLHSAIRTALSLHMVHCRKSSTYHSYTHRYAYSTHAVSSKP